MQLPLAQACCWAPSRVVKSDMAIVKTAIALAPFLLNARTRRPGKRLAGVLMSIVLMIFATAFMISAGSVWVGKTYGAEFGFLAAGSTLFVMSALFYLSSGTGSNKADRNVIEKTSDPLSQYIPEDLKSDPRIQSAIKQIQDHPMGSTAAAVSLGYVLSNRIIGE